MNSTDLNQIRRLEQEARNKERRDREAEANRIRRQEERDRDARRRAAEIARNGR